MKKRISVLLLILTLTNIFTSGFFLLNIARRTELLNEKKKALQNKESKLYTSASLERTILKLKEEISFQKTFYIKEQDNDPIKMTEKIFRFFNENSINVNSYRLEGDSNGKELVINAEGEIGNILLLIYQFSFPATKFRVNFITLDTKYKKDIVSLVIRITYA